MSARVAVLGEGLIDRFVRASGVEDVIGGSPLNTAVALRRAGVEATWWNRVSSDPEGELIYQYALRNEVVGEGVIRTSEPTGVVTIHIDDRGVPSYDFALTGAADWGWQEQELEGFDSPYAVLQVGSLTTALEPGAAVLFSHLQRLHQRAERPLISFDPNARPQAATDDRRAEQMRQRALDLVPLADLVKVSDEDLAWLAPGTPPTATALAWSTAGPQLVVMTKGAEGAAAFVGGVKVAEVPVHPLPLVDTVGAGDTFMAWLLRSVVVDHAVSVPTEPTAVAQMLRSAAKAAAITCSRAGCNPPALAEVVG